jgi:hypothetical protein
MPTMTVNRRLARVSAILAGAVLTTLALASPAFAEDTIDTNLSGVSSNSTAGSRIADPISVTFTNKSNNSVTSIQPVFTIHLDGMPGDGVRIGRVLGSELPAQSAGDGTVQFSDPNTFELLRNGRRTVSYTLLFTSTAPAGKATITIDAYSGNNRLGGDSSSTNVRSNAPRASATPSSSPVNTATGIQPTFAAGPSYSLAPLDPEAAASTPSSSVPVSLYVMGGLLVGVGGLILWLIFRRQKPLAEVAAYPVTEYDQARPSSLGYPRHATPPTHPTAVLPTVQPGLAPPVDPYDGPLPPPPPLPRRPRP